MKLSAIILAIVLVGVVVGILTRVAPKSIHPAKVISGCIICIAAVAVASQIGLLAFLVGVWLLPIITLFTLVYFAVVSLTDKWKGK